MSLAVTYTPDKDLYTADGDFVFNSKWLSAHNPIVFKFESSKYPENTFDNADEYTAVTNVNGYAALTISSGFTNAWYVSGLYVYVNGTKYSGIYKVRYYNPYTISVVLDTPFNGTETGVLTKYYFNYYTELKVSCGLPIAHRWQALKPMVEKSVVPAIPDINGNVVYDIQKIVQADVSTTNNIRLISLPNDINLWTAINVEYAEQWNEVEGIDNTTTQVVSGLADNGGYLQLQIPSPNPIEVGDYVVLGSVTAAYSSAVLRVIEKDESNGDITLNTEYTASPTITAVSVYSIVQRVTSNAFTAQGTTYYAANTKVNFNRYGSNLAQYVNIEEYDELANNLTSFDRIGKFIDKFSDFTAIIDKGLIDSLGANELPAVKILQYDKNGTLLDTDYFTVTNQDEGVYRFLYTGGLTQQTLHSLNFNDEQLNQVIPVTGAFLDMQIATPFNYLLTANLTYQFNTVNTWGAPIINTTNLATFVAAMQGRASGFIRIVTSQANFIEGGLIIQIDYEGFETNTSAITVVMPANRIDQDFIFYCQNFQINTLTSSQAGDQFAYGLRLDDVITVNYNTFSSLAALNSLAAINNDIKGSSFKGVHIWLSEGTGNTGANAKTISITGQFTDSRNRGFITLADRQDNRTFRTALNDNGKIYDGVVDSDVVTAWDEVERTQAWTLQIAFRLTSYSQAAGILFEQGNSSTPGSGYDGERGVIINIQRNGTILLNMANSNVNRLRVQSVLRCKLGFNVIQITYNGNSLASGVNMYINGSLSTQTILNNNLTSTVLQPTVKTLYIGNRALAPSRFFAGRIRVLQLVNNVITNAQLRDAYLMGSMEGIISNPNFLLDINFNGTGTANLTTRASTPTYTINANGGAAYTNFYTP